jgi:DNA helicase-2/ATP-dependent DNA helicase PcrA
MEAYLSELNPAQREAVLHTEGPLLVVAGAGTGKTKTLTHRIFHLIKQGIHPQNILSITFTNKAAAEMRERVAKLLEKDGGYPNDMPFMSTFHSLGVFLLRNHASKMGLPKYFTILDAADQKSLIKEAMESLDINPKQWDPKRIRSIISRNKGDLITQEEFSRNAQSQLTEITSMVWQKYNELMDKNKSVDFDDLLVKSYELLRDHTDVLDHYQTLWKYIHIDEYQDTNTAQFRIAKLLAEKHQNLCVVGDGDQNIYSWRGADMKNILNFEKDYPAAYTIILETNYRSTQTILAAADDIISKNKMRIAKKLQTNNAEGHAVKIYQAFSERDEATFVAEQIVRSMALGVAPSDIAILFRTNFQSRAIEEALLGNGLPYQVLGVKFFDRKEIKDVLAYIRGALNPESLSDIKRIINAPKRGIGPATIVKIFSGQGITLSPALRKKYDAFLETLAKIEEHAHTKPVSETIKYTMRISGLEAMLQEGGEDDLERLANMKELVSYATRYDNLEPEEGVQKLLEDASLMGEQDSLSDGEKRDAVRLMTIHASKGLEFGHVFITGLEQGLFPSQRDNEKKEDNEEERRLMYVAVTRAKEQLYISHAKTRRIYGEQEIQTPSEFIMDMSDDLVEHLASAWNSFGGNSFGDDGEERTFYLDF